MRPKIGYHSSRMLAPDSNPLMRSPSRAFEDVSTREGYERWARVYDGEVNPLVLVEAPLVAEMLGDVAGLRMADLGCGTGRHALRLAAAGAEVTALDFGGGMMELARAKSGAERVRWIEHDLNQPLPLEAAAFDRVLCCLVLDHIAEPAKLLRECRRVCRRDGWALVSTVHPAMLLRGVRAHFTDPATGLDVAPQSYPHQVSDYVMAAQAAGWRIAHMSEHAVDARIAAAYPRAAKFEGWPILLLMRLRDADAA